MTYTEYLQKTTAFKNFVSDSETKPELLETLTKLTSLLEETVTEQEEQMTSMDDTERQESIRNMKVAELKTLCKTNGWTGYSKLKKDDLISFVLRNYGQEDDHDDDQEDDDQEAGEYDSMTVSELKAVCRENSITGYSKLKKVDLLELVKTTMTENENDSDSDPDSNSDSGSDSDSESDDDDQEVDYDSMTVAQLKALCKDNGISGYSKLKKVDLIELLKSVDDQENDQEDDQEDAQDEDQEEDQEDDQEEDQENDQEEDQEDDQEEDQEDNQEDDQEDDQEDAQEDDQAYEWMCDSEEEKSTAMMTMIFTTRSMSASRPTKRQDAQRRQVSNR